MLWGWLVTVQFTIYLKENAEKKNDGHKKQDKSKEKAKSKVIPEEAAIMDAAVVLPVPGGPKKIILGIRPDVARRRRTPLSPTRCFCPDISSKEVGRRRSAAGATRM